MHAWAQKHQTQQNQQTQPQQQHKPQNTKHQNKQHNNNQHHTKTNTHTQPQQLKISGSKKPKILKRRKWKAYIWRRWKKKGRRGRKSTFLKRQVLYLNFIELNYIILSGVIIRKPMLGEILLLAQKKLIASTMLKKLYYLY